MGPHLAAGAQSCTQPEITPRSRRDHAEITRRGGGREASLPLRTCQVLAPCAELARVLSRLGREEESGALLARARALPDLKPVQLHQIEALAAELKGPPKPK